MPKSLSEGFALESRRIAEVACEGYPHLVEIIKPGVMTCYNPAKHGLTYVVLKRLFGLRRIRRVEDFRIGYFLRGLPVYAFRGMERYSLLLAAYPELARLRYKDELEDARREHLTPVSWRERWAGIARIALDENLKHLYPMQRAQLAGLKAADNMELKRRLDRAFRKQSARVVSDIAGFRSKHRMLCPGVLACQNSEGATYVVLRRLFELRRMANAEDFVTDKHIRGFPLYVFRNKHTAPLLFNYPQIAEADYAERCKAYWHHKPSWAVYWNGLAEDMLRRENCRYLPKWRFRLLTGREVNSVKRLSPIATVGGADAV